MAVVPHTPSRGEIIDQAYRVEGGLGAGGVGAVLRATRLRDGCEVALKRLHLQHAADAEARARFEREARALNGLEHPHIIRMLDFGFDELGPYLVMELLEGRSLDRVLAESPIPPEQAVALARQVAAGLAAAHAEGVVHRDVKPENIFVVQPDSPHPLAKLLDFGLARFFDRDRWAEKESLTRDGAVLGTPLYMPAEQSLGQKADTRSDVYALGVVLFEMLAGAPPFDGADRLALVRAHAMSPLPPIDQHRRGLTLSPALHAVVERALAKDANQRYADAVTLHAALASVPHPAAWLR
ncbi:MAG: serine/threonine-protein kinase [Polyangiales bacterium]|nr:serine/threonine protein kinase [Myxococcales bacterium]MCB9661223.1 serine/threonine protein kinase [Sandaracinaceae bacterium]